MAITTLNPPLVATHPALSASTRNVGLSLLGVEDSAWQRMTSSWDSTSILTCAARMSKDVPALPPWTQHVHLISLENPCV